MLEFINLLIKALARVLSYDTLWDDLWVKKKLEFHIIVTVNTVTSVHAQKW